MRIGFGTTTLARGLEEKGLDGIGYYTKELGESLIQLGYDLNPISFGPSNIDTLFNKTVIKLPKFSYNAAISCVLGINHFGSQKTRNAIDLYHATDHHIPKFKDVPVVATIMDAIPMAHPEWVNQNLRALKNHLFKRTAHWANRVTTISEYSKTDLVNYLDIQPKKIDVIPLGVDNRYFEAVDANVSTDYLAKLGLVPRSFFYASVHSSPIKTSAR